MERDVASLQLTLEVTDILPARHVVYAKFQRRAREEIKRKMEEAKDRTKEGLGVIGMMILSIYTTTTHFNRHRTREEDVFMQLL